YKKAGLQRTLVLIKPDAFERSLVAEIMGRIEKKNFKIVSMKFWSKAPRNLIEQHYKEHSEQSYFNDLCDFMVSGPIISIVYEGTDAISKIRRLQGNTNPLASAPGTIRGDLANDIGENLIHASDSEDSAVDEISIWFPETKMETDN
uniref:Nucleoside diphosphate kinase n=1 Tax=Acanthamoeba polyphaga mimivirus TaxID=212035 RepID=UPI0001A5EF7E|nr:Chain A, Nucleoside diphosphate kinase [Acanthamoeba polyphaga mimivirus]3DDI_B Chain B, Nucleoside diphosphate kinase [Acanthamoeba polyphaga mimivirus]3DKD_A Chain A, Nucleoside diphosphate kinase [Acanthamoeba polyphaga mimivirus]3DKD_B Chain B, Nucleoside diphosphate kinase [Acanthamoeba polyphaga mimivirus]3ENA_A Chain A, Nucleoside diphosphate kinase [Acanthamoeba polyphaga mimivirus]3ENA_B Chain B, Nucleoside diphosphate kinase [Acanthamoeba polyphaga mimivirus]3ETM_A Chain A, Nucle